MYIYTNSLSLTVTAAIGMDVAVITFLLSLALDQKWRLRRSGISDADAMSGREFELYLRELFEMNGYAAQVAPAAGDFGADLLLKKEGRTIVIQAKRYRKKIVIKAVQEVMHIVYDFELDEVVVQFEETTLPLRLMSAGYWSVIGMVADLAFRMSLLNPQLKGNAVRKTPSVVLIDEMDLHLHPKWQWKIGNDFKQTFPNDQFIASTHELIVIFSCKNEEIIRLNDEQSHQAAATPYGSHPIIS